MCEVCTASDPTVTESTSVLRDDSSQLRTKLPIMLRLIRVAAMSLRILPSLMYEEMDMRGDRIPQAHADTFGWVFDNETLGFTDWLADASGGVWNSCCGIHIITDTSPGLFWVTGKPGSGKSTLMKYIVHNISQHPHTKPLLERWRANRQLCFAHHYFWCAGNPLQKTQNGLIRSLLAQIFQQFPDMLLRLLPPDLKDSDMDGKMITWSTARLVEALSKLGQQDDLDICFCLFIDGLDEYDGEHGHIIRFLNLISESPNVKLCVSSRPWNVFTHAYGRRRQLAVQELTQSDLKRYISDTLQNSDLFVGFQQLDPLGCRTLLDEISNKAQGVFLWVYLVGRSLLRGLQNGDSMDILLARVREMPDSLDGFFRRMFDRVESVYRVHAARILLAALHADYTLPLSTPEYVAEEMRNPNYAIEMSITSAEITVTTQRIRQARTTIDARCADLLEASCHGISCLHRTVKDFLRQDEISQRLQKHSGEDFNVGLCLSRLALANLKAGHTGDLPTQIDRILQCEQLVGEIEAPLFLDLLANFNDYSCEWRSAGFFTLEPTSRIMTRLSFAVQPQQSQTGESADTHEDIGCDSGQRLADDSEGTESFRVLFDQNNSSDMRYVLDSTGKIWLQPHHLRKPTHEHFAIFGK